ncbi:MAG: UDP-N-acetylmuramate dehydrogenase [Chitinophagaceae bacterium]|nr:UDP-N-acetylmuramate dehydrogenase [Chitinophagaceae bacterium]
MQIRENISLKPYNTFAVDAKARYFSSFNSVDMLHEILEQSLTKLKVTPNSKLRTPNSQLVLGGGSNILFTTDFDGLVLKNEIKGIEVVKEDDDHVYIKVGAGENWHQFVLHCLQHNYAGVENLSLIPGNVGASPMQNIGAYGVEIKDVFHELEAFYLNEKTNCTFSLNDCEFGYRDSVFKGRFKDQFVITCVTYRLNKRPVFNINYGALKQELERMNVQKLRIQIISQAVINIRSSKLPDPAVLGNAGSFFKNPQIPKHEFHELKRMYPNMPSFPVNEISVKVPAGWLIEQCGWKGYRKGDAGCYEKQALVLVNYGNATGKEIYELSEKIAQSVKQKFGVRLEREVNIIPAA